MSHLFQGYPNGAPGEGKMSLYIRNTWNEQAICGTVPSHYEQVFSDTN